MLGKDGTAKGKGQDRLLERKELPKGGEEMSWGRVYRHRKGDPCKGRAGQGEGEGTERGEPRESLLIPDRTAEPLITRGPE